MTVNVRGLRGPEIDAVISQYNKLRGDFVLAQRSVVLATQYHYEVTPLVLVPDAVVDGYAVSASSLLNACVTAYSTHIASFVDGYTGVGAHKVADTTNVISAPAATNLATAITLSDQLKAQYNLHIPSTTFHQVADAVNAVTLSNNATEANLVALVNQIKAKLNAHLAGSYLSQGITLVSP